MVKAKLPRMGKTSIFASTVEDLPPELRSPLGSSGSVPVAAPTPLAPVSSPEVTKVFVDPMTTAPMRSGRPQVHGEPWTKVTALLLNRQIISLDELSTRIRARDGKVVRRSDILQALVDALVGSGMDLSSVRSKEDLRATLLLRLRG